MQYMNLYIRPIQWHKSLCMICLFWVYFHTIGFTQLTPVIGGIDTYPFKMGRPFQVLDYKDSTIYLLRVGDKMNFRSSNANHFEQVAFITTHAASQKFKMSDIYPIHDILNEHAPDATLLRVLNTYVTGQGIHIQMHTFNKRKVVAEVYEMVVSHRGEFVGLYILARESNFKNRRQSGNFFSFFDTWGQQGVIIHVPHFRASSISKLTINRYINGEERVPIKVQLTYRPRNFQIVNAHVNTKGNVYILYRYLMGTTGQSVYYMMCITNANNVYHSLITKDEFWPNGITIWSRNDSVYMAGLVGTQTQTFHSAFVRTYSETDTTFASPQTRFATDGLVVPPRFQSLRAPGMQDRKHTPFQVRDVLYDATTQTHYVMGEMAHSDPMCLHQNNECTADQFYGDMYALKISRSVSLEVFRTPKYQYNFSTNRFLGFVPFLYQSQVYFVYNGAYPQQDSNVPIHTWNNLYYIEKSYFETYLIEGESYSPQVRLNEFISNSKMGMKLQPHCSKALDAGLVLWYAHPANGTERLVFLPFK